MKHTTNFRPIYPSVNHAHVTTTPWRRVVIRRRVGRRPYRVPPRFRVAPRRGAPVTERDIRECRIVEQAKAAIAMQAPGASAFQKAAEATKAHSKNTARRVL